MLTVRHPAVKVDLLWTNSSPSTDVGSGTIILSNVAEYDLFLILTCPDSGNTGVRKVNILVRGYTCVCDMKYYSDSTRSYRTFSINDTGIYYSGGQQSNAYAIPCNVYGVKLS